MLCGLLGIHLGLDFFLQFMNVVVLLHAMSKTKYLLFTTLHFMDV
jgi:hypothetical protein